MINLELLEQKNKELQAKVNSLEGKSILLKQQIEKSECKIAVYKQNKILYTKEIELLTLVQELTRNKIKEGFESIVTYALRFIFNQDYKFELSFNRRGNLQEVDFNIIPSDRKESSDPLDSSGGGVLDVVSLALRIVLLELSKPKIPGFIALDESTKHISKEYLPNVYKWIKIMSTKLSRQFIFVTHQSEFINLADNSIELKGGE
jgi:DNA repair exonuclease SbcCD ATPase subunit